MTVNNPEHGQRPLDGIRVLDLSRAVAAPFCAQVLADMGADVVKVEKPGTGDDTRHLKPQAKADGGTDVPASGFNFIAMNRNKKSITVNLASPEGQEIVRKLAQESDVLIENYKVGDLRRYGLDYESLRAINPALIYCSVTGYGQTGPYADRPGPATTACSRRKAA